MLQYCLNVTAIWLMSLVLFDIFLKRQSHHGYNRAYLLLTFALGFLLPLWEWQERTNIDNNEAAVLKPADAVAVLKHNVTEAEPVQAFMNFDNWLMLLYAAGVVISLALLVKEAFVIARLYRKGRKSKDGVWTIVETGKKHSPFSALNTIFISNKQDYETEELHTIMTHEQKHVVAFHFIDLLIMQLSKTLLWFHPLVYVYHQRLMMVHEYQADRSAVTEPASYGKFLLEQAMLHRAPDLSHSFNRSPIKNRIIMLTRTSSSNARYLLPLPLLLMFMLCFTKNSFSGERKLTGNKLTFNGNVFDVKIFPKDTFEVEDPVTGKTSMMVSSREPLPLTVNKEPIYEEQDLTTPISLKNLTQNQLRTKVIDNNKKNLAPLKDGRYQLNLHTLVLDKKGKVVYYEEPYIIHLTDVAAEREAKENIEKAVKGVSASIENLNIFLPAKLNGRPVAAFYSGIAGKPYTFEVKNHVVTLVE